MNDRPRKPLGLSGGAGAGSTPTGGKPSFNRTRSSPIVVEKKKRRLIKPAGGAAPTGGSATSSPMQSTDKDVQRRMKALEEAKRLESARQSTDQQEASLREEEREERRRQRIEKDKVEQDIHNKKRGLTQKDAKPEVKKEPPKEADKDLGKEASKDSPKPTRDTAPAPQDLPQSIPQDILQDIPQDIPQDMGDKPKSRGPSARGKNLEPQNEDKKTHRPNARSGDNERRRAGKLTISQALQDNDGHQRSLASIKRKQERQRRELRGEPAPREKIIRDVQLPPTITVQELANRMAEKTNSVVKALMTNGIMATQNETIDADTAELIVAEFGHNITRVSDADVEDAIEQTPDLPADLRPRAPVVTIMGHVDHGKTSVLDALRKTSVVTGEAGGITQHIGAYQITAKSGTDITFLDTPGHAAFTSMRARGAQVTDIVILVVAANDSVKPQTIEAISHALAAKVPVIVAINKTDLPDADINKVRTDLLQHNIVVESMSGDVQDVEISAKTGAGLDNLVDAISLQAELLELQANPDRLAQGAVIEAKLDTGRGPVASVLIQHGTLKKGDIFVAGEHWGKVRALINDKGERVDIATPSMPIEVLGLNSTPEAGDILNVVISEAKAREICDYRQTAAKDRRAAVGANTTLDQLLAKARADEVVSELPLVIKADVQGSAEAIIQALEKIGNDEVRVRILHYGVGAITESDITLAEASSAQVIGFNVRANAPARASANQKGLTPRYYSIIYDLVDDIKAAASGLLSAEIKETFIGYATIKKVYKITGAGKIGGCEVTEGKAERSAGVRLLRDDVVIHQGTLKTLKRFKDEVKEVKSGQECGMAFENYEDIREGDVIEIFTIEEIARNL